MADNAGNDTKYVLPKLKNSKDYPIWRRLIQGLLKKNAVWHCVTQEPPAPAASIAVRNKWTRDNDKAMFDILAHICPEAVIVVTSIIDNNSTCKEVWEKLRTTYEKDNQQNKLNLKAKLVTYKYEDGQDFNELLNKFQQTYNELASLGEAMSDPDKLSYLLRCLPESLSTVSMIVEGNCMEYDSICALIKSELDRRVSKSSTDKGEAVQPSARKSATPRGQRPTHKMSKSDIQCWYCGRKGHVMKDCRKRKNGVQKSRGFGKGKYSDRYGNQAHRGRSHNGQSSDFRKPKPDRTVRWWDKIAKSREESSDSDDDNRRQSPRDTQKREPRGFMARMNSTSETPKAFLDSGANENFVPDRSAFVDYRPLSTSNVTVCAGTSIIVGEGTITIPLDGGDIIIHCKHAPDFDDDIFSLSRLAESVQVEFNCSQSLPSFVLIHKLTSQQLHVSVQSNGLFPLPAAIRHNATSLRANSDVNNERKPDPDPSAEWHSILGHIGVDRLLKAPDQVIGVPTLHRDALEAHQCIPYIEAASKRAPVRSKQHQVTHALDLTHADISGRINPASFGGAYYIAAFLDDRTAMSAVYFLRHRSEFITSVKQYKALSENQLRSRMYAVRLDRAGENKNREMYNFALQQGMVLEYSPAYGHQSNGAAERLIQELWKMSRTLLFSSKLPVELWAEAISHSNWLRNRLPSSRAQYQTPYTLWHGRKPDLSNLLKFGQTGYAFRYRPDAVRSRKFLPRSIFGYFLGMESTLTLYRVYHSDTKSISICRAADFTVLDDTKKLPSFADMMTSITRMRTLHEQDGQGEGADIAEESIAQCMYVHHTQHPVSYKVNKRDHRLPRSFSEACKDKDWAEAIDREYNAMVERNTWTYVKLQSGMEPVPFLWDWRIKETPGSNVAILHKARCCLRGDKQLAFRDFDPDQLYAPVARHETIRMLLAKVAAQDLLLEGLDVSSAYLYGDIDTPLLMHQPTDSSGIPAKPGHVVLLRKSLYGARQAGKIWGTMVHDFVISLGFVNHEDIKATVND